MSSSNDTTRTMAGGSDKEPSFVLTRQKLSYIARWSVIAMIFTFVLQYYGFKSSLQDSLMWAAMFGAMAFTLAFRQVKQQVKQQR